MATITKNIPGEKGINSHPNTGAIKAHGNDPVVLKKVKEASETILRVGLPGQKNK